MSRGWCNHGVIPGEYCPVCALEARIEAAWDRANYYAEHARILKRQMREWWDKAWLASGITGSWQRREPEPGAFALVCMLAEERARYVLMSRHDVAYALHLEGERA